MGDQGSIKGTLPEYVMVLKGQLCLFKGWYNILDHLTEGVIKGAQGNIKGVQGSIKGTVPEYVMVYKGSTMLI